MDLGIEGVADHVHGVERQRGAVELGEIGPRATAHECLHTCLGKRLARRGEDRLVGDHLAIGKDEHPSDVDLRFRQGSGEILQSSAVGAGDRFDRQGGVERSCLLRRPRQ